MNTTQAFLDYIASLDSNEPEDAAVIDLVRIIYDAFCAGREAGWAEIADAVARADEAGRKGCPWVAWAPPS